MDGKRIEEREENRINGKTKITVVQKEGYTQILVEGHNSNTNTCAGISAIVETCKLGLHALANSVDNIEYKERWEK